VAEGDVAVADDAGSGLGPEIRGRAVGELASRFDARSGGFGGAPKFPPDAALAFLLREHARSGDDAPRTMATATLDAMAAGGMHDQVGGGFARYSVDDRWLVPHFEKMLYNQALLVPVYADAWVLTGRRAYRRAVARTTDFVRREMTHPEGGLYASLDADSEGVEGRFYVWTPDEVRAVLGDDADLLGRVLGIDEVGNFEGRSIPNLPAGDLEAAARREGAEPETFERAIDALLARLLEARGRRVRPATDDKILTSWNGLMITAFCRAAQVFGRDVDVDSARRAADFALAHLEVDGRLRATWREGRARLNGYLDDHAFLGRGLLDLYETTFERRYLDAAGRIATVLVERFEDRERGGFWFVSDDHEALLARTRTAHDGALPAGGAVAAEVLSRLGRHLGEERFREAARRALASVRPSVLRMPSAHATTLLAAAWEDGSAREIAIGGDRSGTAFGRMLETVRRRLVPPVVVAAGAPVDADLALLAGRSPGTGAVAAYVCRDGACEAPTSDPDDLARRLDAAIGG
jgi:uncharacterized protein YyaL (SSP411 family)